jgi:hypothetical protein
MLARPKDNRWRWPMNATDTGMSSAPRVTHRVLLRRNLAKLWSRPGDLSFWLTGNASLAMLAASLLVVQFVQLFLLILFEKVEYDTFTYYFSKVELMRFWTVGHAPVISYVQDFMPVGFSKFQLLFASGSYARNAGNYIVVLAVAAYILAFTKRLFLPLLFLALTNVAFFMQYTGYKADAPLAGLSLVLLHIASRPHFPLQFTAAVAIACVAASIKWTSGLVIIPALLIYLWHLFRGRTRISPHDIIVAFGVIAVFSAWLDLGLYFDTYRATGSFIPTETYGVSGLRLPDPILMAVNFVKYASVCIIETFEALWRNLIYHPPIGRLIETLTLGTKTSVVMNANQVYATLNVFDLFGIVACILVLRCKNAFVWSCGVAALFYYSVSFSVYPYQTIANRYLLPAQIISYVPLIYLGWMIALSWSRRLPEATRARLGLATAAAVAVIHLANSSYLIVVDKERNLVPIIDTMFVSTKSIQERAVPKLDVRYPVYKDDTVGQLFRGWQGYQSAYLALQQYASQSIELQIIFDSSANDVDYVYPFLKARQVANTNLTDIRNVPSAEIHPTSARILCFGRRACSLRPADYDEHGQVAGLVALWVRR